MSAEYIFAVLSQPQLLLLCAIGTFAGIYVGAIPGLSGTMAVSLLVSYTYSWDTESAVALMIGVFAGAVFGGSRSAILFNIPGAPAAVATGFDGYPMAKRGEAGRAMGLATTQSVIGTLLGVLALALCAPLIAKLALNFRSVDYLMLALMGMLMTGSLGGGSLLKGMISACIGIFIGCVGMDSLTAVNRFTFGVAYLNSGVSFIVALIGLFGVSEVLCQLAGEKDESPRRQTGKIIPSWKESLKFLPLTLRSALIGVLIGALPGAGGDMAALLAYDNAKRTVRHPEYKFGEGTPEGVVAPETANNAAIGGAFIPMLTLGIPGDAVTAVLIGALTVHGLRPGPGFITESPDIFNLIVVCLCFASLFMLLFGLTGIRLFVKITEVPKGILMPLILVLSVVGAYAINNSVFDVLWMLGFGILGFFMKSAGYPTSPAVLGIILCDLLETNFIRGVKLGGGIGGLVRGIFLSPISCVLLVLTVILILTQTPLPGMIARRAEKRKNKKTSNPVAKMTKR